MNIEAMVATLPIAVKGMAGVFAVILAVWASIAVLLKLFRK